MLSDTTIRRDSPPSFPRRALLALRKAVSHKYRGELNAQMREKLKDVKPFTIFSNNCLGGVFYSDAGCQFTSPLINTAMDGEDFLKFVSNPHHYLNHEMEFITWRAEIFRLPGLMILK